MAALIKVGIGIGKWDSDEIFGRVNLHFWMNFQEFLLIFSRVMEILSFEKQS